MPADVIDYELIGDDLQAVIITLDPGEAVVAEAGAMMYMQDGITMATTLDPNQTGGGLFDKLIGAAPRAGGRRREEGSLLGGLGRLLDGDR